MSGEVREHTSYIGDDHKISAYMRALQEVVKPGDVVLDLGAGTGLLGFLAARSGAARVYSIDRGNIVAVGRDLARANGFAHQVFIRGQSTETDLPEPVDVVICDQMGPSGFDAGLFNSYRDAARRHLRTGGSLMPARLELGSSLVAAPSLRKLITTWSTQPADIDLATALPWVVNQRYWCSADEIEVLGPWMTSRSVDVAGNTPADLAMKDQFVADGNTQVDGIAVWWTAHLTDNVTLTNSPSDPQRVDRMVGLLPLQEPLVARPGETFELGVRPTADGRAMSWTVKSITEPARLSETHSTLLGELLPIEELEGFAPDSSRPLGSRAKARLDVLTDADSGLTLREIEERCATRHATVVGSLADVQRFVREVLRDSDS
jgi:protein arginine N-methyltransferase 1